MQTPSHSSEDVASLFGIPFFDLIDFIKRSLTQAHVAKFVRDIDECFLLPWIKCTNNVTLQIRSP